MVIINEMQLSIKLTGVRIIGNLVIFLFRADFVLEQIVDSQMLFYET